MELLNQLIGVLNKEELRSIKLWLQSSHATKERKDVALLDYIRKSGERYNEELIFGKLYGEGDKNSFYRLKNRLLEDIGHNLSLLHFDKQQTNNLYLYLGLYNIFVARSQPAIALYYLKKAEKRATQSENIELLDIIYASFIKLSEDLSGLNPEVYIQMRKQNAEKLNRIRETDQVLAAVKYRLKLGQNFGTRDTGLLKLLDNTVKEFAADESIKNSKTFQTRVYRAVSQALIQSHNFVELERYMLQTYQRFVNEKWFDKANHETRLQMLIYIVNALFKNKKYRESLDYAETLGEEMGAYNNMLYSKYLFFYYNSLMINYAQIDINRGLKALDEMEQEIKGLKNAYYEFFLLLNRANLLFFKQRYNDAIRNLVRLYVNDHYKKADSGFKLKIAVAECIMQYESGDKEITKKRVEQVRKQYSKSLLTPVFKREDFVLKLIAKMSEAEPAGQAKVIREIERFVNQPVTESVEDGEVLKYRVWLHSKLPAAKLA